MKSKRKYLSKSDDVALVLAFLLQMHNKADIMTFLFSLSSGFNYYNPRVRNNYGRYALVITIHGITIMSFYWNGNYYYKNQNELLCLQEW